MARWTRALHWMDRSKERGRQRAIQSRSFRTFLWYHALSFPFSLVLFFVLPVSPLHGTQRRHHYIPLIVCTWSKLLMRRNIHTQLHVIPRNQTVKEKTIVLVLDRHFCGEAFLFKHTYILQLLCANPSTIAVGGLRSTVRLLSLALSVFLICFVLRVGTVLLFGGSFQY